MYINFLIVLPVNAMLFVSFGLNMIFAIIMYEIFEKNLANFLIGKYVNRNN